MLILALDTSGAKASCALMRDGALIAEEHKDTNLDHSRTILPLCEEMLKRHGVSMGEIDLFAASVGPGSFTGIRIGVAAVKGFAWAGGKPAASVSSLESAAWETEGDGLICALIKARDGEYYTARFERRGDEVTRLDEDTCLEGKQIAALLEGSAPGLCGDGAADFACIFPQPEYRLSGKVQGAAGVARAAAHMAEKGKLISAFDLAPVYLKKPQAERMREEKERENSNRV